MCTEASRNVSPIPPVTLEIGTSMISSDVIPAPIYVPVVVMPAPPDPRYPYDWKKYDKTPWDPNSSSRFSVHSMSALCPETIAGLTIDHPRVLTKSLLAPSAPPAPPTDHLNAPCSVLIGGPLERCIDLSTWGGRGEADEGPPDPPPVAVILGASKTFPRPPYAPLMSRALKASPVPSAPPYAAFTPRALKTPPVKR